MNEKTLRKVLAYLSIAVFLCSLLPILYLAGVDRASGDDWGYGLLTHRAWINTHSMIDVIKAACTTVKNFYDSWQGTWFSIFLFSLQPEVFSFQAYWIVPYLMLLLLISGVSCALYQVLVKVMHFSVTDYLLIDSVMLLLIVHGMPYKTSSIFWYNGAAHYTVPFALALFSVFFAIRFARSSKIQDIVCVTILMTLLGGTNYLAAIWGLLSVVFFAVFYFKKNKKVILLSIPVILEICGLLVSALAPGNARRGGAAYEITMSRMLLAVVESFKEGFLGIFHSVREYPVSIAAMLVLAVILWDISGDIISKHQLHFPLPGIVILYFFCTYCAIYWPVKFADVDVSGGVPNTIYWVLILTLFGCIVYGMGWIVETFSRNKEAKENIKKYFYIGGFAAALLIVFINRSSLKNSTAYVCLNYIRTGQAADYKAQMEQFEQLLTDDNVPDVVLPMINNEQGPLMHMPVIDDPEAYTNQVVKNFFGKNSVIAIPREEWNKLY